MVCHLISLLHLRGPRIPTDPVLQAGQLLNFLPDCAAIKCPLCGGERLCMQDREWAKEKQRAQHPGRCLFVFPCVVCGCPLGLNCLQAPKMDKITFGQQGELMRSTDSLRHLSVLILAAHFVLTFLLWHPTIIFSLHLIIFAFPIKQWRSQWLQVLTVGAHDTTLPFTRWIEPCQLLPDC